METRSETPRETWLQPIVALLGEGEFAEAYALAAYFPNTRNRQLVQLAALLGQNKVTEASDLLGGLSRSWIRMMIKEPQEMSESVTQILVAEFATILSQVDLNLLETAYKAIENRYFQLADFCIQFQLLTHPETSLSVIGERLRKTEFVQKYLGEGPRMVRDVFRLAKENSPAIIFIDEIDAIATKRFDAQTGGKL